MTEWCDDHDRAKPCPACQILYVAIPGSGVLTGSFRSVEEMKEHYGEDAFAEWPDDD